MSLNSMLFTAALMVLCGPALAINKCTGADGKVVFQDGACPNTSKADEVKIFNKISGAQGSWRFLKQNDNMTGAVTCFAFAPEAGIGSLKDYPYVRLHIAMRGDVVSLVLRTGSDTELFHNDIDGMGVKVDSNNFVGVNNKVNANAVAFDAAARATLVEQFSSGKAFRIRARFWPRNALGDTDSISLTGFKQAYAQAAQCAKSV